MLKGIKVMLVDKVKDKLRADKNFLQPAPGQTKIQKVDR